MPSVAEQQQIVDYLTHVNSRFQPSLDTAGAEIVLIQELRTRLIADVVSGKLDVRAAAASLPEVTKFEPAEMLADDEEAEADLEQAETEELAA